ncbi:MAG: thermonuclease family protein, partial [Candidatus Nitrosocosmicus sp.]|nr:thermonuclease family protein [Candidatus Nitrosocosmicus sp.]MDN5866880.1 thermonuclease family protein [Candidatus Nitrosocosmicus sp.]
KIDLERGITTETMTLDLGYDSECPGNDDDEDSSGSSSDDDDKSSSKGESDDDKSDNNKNENSNRFAETTSTNGNSISSFDRCSGNANCFTGTISKVVDGDTVDVDGEIRIRLSLVNTPEQGEQGYQEAKDFVNSDCGVGTKVLVDEDDGQKAGSYGRMIGFVYCGDEKLLLNQRLIENGYAQIFEEYCERSEFSILNWAQSNGCSG